MKLPQILAALVFFSACLIVLISGCSNETNSMLESSAADNTGDSKLHITVLFNNIPGIEGLRTEWGFSCLIEGLEKTILFDTGLKDDVLLSNMEKLDIDPGAADLVVLSHYHRDHTNGLARINERNPKAHVYMPQSFPESFQQAVRGFPAYVTPVGKPMMVFEGVHTTGEMKKSDDSIIEQSLVIDRPDGLVIVSGCAHPGVVEIAKKARQIIDRDISLIIGGFHLMGASDEHIREIIAALKEIGVKRVAPTHCTGERAMTLFREAYEDKYLDAGLGVRLDV